VRNKNPRSSLNRPGCARRHDHRHARRRDSTSVSCLSSLHVREEPLPASPGAGGPVLRGRQPCPEQLVHLASCHTIPAAIYSYVPSTTSGSSPGVPPQLRASRPPLQRHRRDIKNKTAVVLHPGRGRPSAGVLRDSAPPNRCKPLPPACAQVGSFLSWLVVSKKLDPHLGQKSRSCHWPSGGSGVEVPSSNSSFPAFTLTPQNQCLPGASAFCTADAW